MRKTLPEPTVMLTRELRHVARWLDTVRKGIDPRVRREEYQLVRRHRDMCRLAALRVEELAAVVEDLRGVASDNIDLRQQLRAARVSVSRTARLWGKHSEGKQ